MKLEEGKLEERLKVRVCYCCGVVVSLGSAVISSMGFGGGVVAIV